MKQQNPTFSFIILKIYGFNHVFWVPRSQMYNRYLFVFYICGVGILVQLHKCLRLIVSQSLSRTVVPLYKSLITFLMT